MLQLNNTLFIHIISFRISNVQIATYQCFSYPKPDTSPLFFAFTLLLQNRSGWTTNPSLQKTQPTLIQLKRVTKQTKYSHENWNLIRYSKLNRFLVILFARGSKLFEHSLYHLIKKRQKKEYFWLLSMFLETKGE